MNTRSIRQGCRFVAAIGLLGIIPLQAQQLEKGLFESDDLLTITLKGPVSDVLEDRKGTPRDHAMVLSYRGADNQDVAIPVNIKTRGHFRRQSKICSYPPLSIQFPNGGPHEATVFREQRKLKLVMPCVDDEYVVREYLVYKLYNKISPISFRARLVRVTLLDERDSKPRPAFYGILLEEEDQLAKRLHYITLDSKLKPQQIQREAFLTMAVFQYMIGNTDWSIQYLQNVKLFATDAHSLPVAVPYDFDHAGIVDAPYAKPAEELHLRSTRERRYRGYCMEDPTLFEPVIEKYRGLKDNLFSIYTDNPQLDEKSSRITLEFLNSFFAILSDPQQYQKEFAYPCDKSGTGNVVIKGLKEK